MPADRRAVDYEPAGPVVAPGVPAASIELLVYQVQELKSLLQEISRDFKSQFQSQGERIGRLEQERVAHDARIKNLEEVAKVASPLHSFVKFGTAALAILSALLGSIALFGGR